MSGWKFAMVIQPCVAGTGDCGAALNFYQSVFGGEITFTVCREQDGELRVILATGAKILRNRNPISLTSNSPESSYSLCPCL